MRKLDERNAGESCWNKAGEDEWMFILLERDPAAPATIRAWIRERIRLGIDLPDSPKIRDAERCASMMEQFNK